MGRKKILKKTTTKSFKVKDKLSRQKKKGGISSPTQNEKPTDLIDVGRPNPWAMQQHVLIYEEKTNKFDVVLDTCATNHTFNNVDWFVSSTPIKMSICTVPGDSLMAPASEFLG